jgi:hypothetical protein
MLRIVFLNRVAGSNPAGGTHRATAILLI